VISLAILHHLDATADERAAYLKLASAARRAVTGDGEEAAVPAAEAEEAAGDIELGQEKYAEMGASEQFILTVSENGYGKRSSSFEYRVTGRGGKGIVAMVVNERNGRLVGSFPVEDRDEIMLISDGGQTIRMPVEGDKPIRIAGRSTQGVTIFNTAEGEKVVSVERIGDSGESEGEGEAGDTGVAEGGEPGAEA
jgi:DNA gyrase subunit A